MNSSPYAGFNISLEPAFSVSRLCYILAYEGVYAVANLRWVVGYLNSGHPSSSHPVLVPVLILRQDILMLFVQSSRKMAMKHISKEVGTSSTVPATRGHRETFIQGFEYGSPEAICLYN